MHFPEAELPERSPSEEAISGLGLQWHIFSKIIEAAEAAGWPSDDLLDLRAAQARSRRVRERAESREAGGS